MTDPTYNVALTERQIRALAVLAETIEGRPDQVGSATRDFYRDINKTMRNRLARIEAEKGESRGHDSRP